MRRSSQSGGPWVPTDLPPHMSPSENPGPTPETSSAAKSTGIVSIAILCSRLLGLVRDQLVNGLFGSHDAEVGEWKAYLGILLRRDDPAAVAG